MAVLTMADKRGWANAYVDLAKEHATLQLKYTRLKDNFANQEQLLHNAYAEISILTYDNDQTNKEHTND